MGARTTCWQQAGLEAAERGWMYLTGQGVEQDYGRAAELLQIGWNNGSVAALGLLGWLYLEGAGVPQNVGTALSLLWEAHRLGDKAATGVLGSMYLDGNGVEPDKTLAVQLLHESRQRGFVAASRVLGKLYVEGDGVERDVEAGLAMIWEAKEQGDPAAQELFQSLQHHENHAAHSAMLPTDERNEDVAQAETVEPLQLTNESAQLLQRSHQSQIRHSSEVGHADVTSTVIQPSSPQSHDALQDVFTDHTIIDDRPQATVDVARLELQIPVGPRLPDFVDIQTSQFLGSDNNTDYGSKPNSSLCELPGSIDLAALLEGDPSALEPAYFAVSQRGFCWIHIDDEVSDAARIAMAAAGEFLSGAGHGSGSTETIVGHFSAAYKDGISILTGGFTPSTPLPAKLGASFYKLAAALDEGQAKLARQVLQRSCGYPNHRHLLSDSANSYLKNVALLSGGGHRYGMLDCVRCTMGPDSPPELVAPHVDPRLLVLGMPSSPGLEFQDEFGHWRAPPNGSGVLWAGSAFAAVKLGVHRVVSVKGAQRIGLWHEFCTRDQLAPPMLKMLQEGGEKLEYNGVRGTAAALRQLRMEENHVMAGPALDSQGVAFPKPKKKGIKLTKAKLERPASCVAEDIVSIVKIEDSASSGSTVPSLASAGRPGNTITTVLGTGLGR